MSFAYSIDDRLAVVTLDDGKVNAMSLSFFQELTAVLARAEQDDAGALVVAGRPGAFSAGLNLKLLPTLPPDELKATLVEFGHTMLRVFTSPVPLVAAVTGHAIAGGAFLALASDARVMADGPYRLQMNEVAIGLTVPSWAIAIAESVIGPRWRTEAILHARAYSPEEALGRGFVDAVVDPDDVLPRARALAAPLLALDRKSYAITKRRQRSTVVRWAEALIDSEMVGLPITPARRA